MDAAIVAGLAALLGLAVGRFWDTHTEARRWRRDQRIRIYEQFAGAYYTSREAYRAVAMHQPGSVEEDAAASAALDLGAGFNRTVVAVWLPRVPVTIHIDDRAAPSGPTA